MTMGNYLCYNKYRLNKLDAASVDFFSFEHFICYAKVVDIYDGDTCTLLFIWKNIPIKIRCRMYGYDSPELKPKLNIPNRHETIKTAIAAKEALINYTNFLNSPIICVEFKKFDKYGRPLVILYNYMNENINDKMILNGYGYSYHGGTKNVIIEV